MKACMSMGFFLISLATAHANIHEVPDDSIPNNTPLFDPVVVEDSLPVNEDGDMVVPDLKDLGFRAGPGKNWGSAARWALPTPARLATE